MDGWIQKHLLHSFTFKHEAFYTDFQCTGGFKSAEYWTCIWDVHKPLKTDFKVETLKVNVNICLLVVKMMKKGRIPHLSRYMMRQVRMHPLTKGSFTQILWVVELTLGRELIKCIAISGKLLCWCELFHSVIITCMYPTSAGYKLPRISHNLHHVTVCTTLWPFVPLSSWIGLKSEIVERKHSVTALEEDEILIPVMDLVASLLAALIP